MSSESNILASLGQCLADADSAVLRKDLFMTVDPSAVRHEASKGIFVTHLDQKVAAMVAGSALPLTCNSMAFRLNTRRINVMRTVKRLRDFELVQEGSRPSATKRGRPPVTYVATGELQEFVAADSELRVLKELYGLGERLGFLTELQTLAYLVALGGAVLESRASV